MSRHESHDTSTRRRTASAQIALRSVAFCALAGVLTLGVTTPSMTGCVGDLMCGPYFCDGHRSCSWLEVAACPADECKVEHRCLCEANTCPSSDRSSITAAVRAACEGAANATDCGNNAKCRWIPFCSGEAKCSGSSESECEANAGCHWRRNCN